MNNRIPRCKPVLLKPYFVEKITFTFATNRTRNGKIANNLVWANSP